MSATRRLFLLLLVLVVTLQQDCSEGKPDMSISFHAHLDAFWLKTEEQLRNINFVPDGWFYSVANQRNSKKVFNAMYDALTAAGKKQRRYFISEVYFFRDWYEYLDSGRKETVRGLLRSGQLEIVNSAWVQNDEAICYYDDIIQQYTFGMNYMHEEFRYRAKLGWATDAFGHSHSQAALLNELGLEMQVVERMDGRYIYHHKNGPLLEWFWLTRSDSNNLTYGGLLTNLRHFPHEPSNMRSYGNGAAASDINSFLSIMTKLYGKNLIFKFYGDDFEEILPFEFQNLEKGMSVLNKDHNCSAIHYGNPSEYLEKLKKYYGTKDLPTRYFDLMPNYDMGSYWTGYYTTYPELKKLCKDSSRLLNLYKKALLHAVSTRKNIVVESLVKKTDAGERLLAIMQHHDGITATSKHHVTVDMMKKMKKENDNILGEFSKLYEVDKMVECRLHENHNQCTLSNNVKESVGLVIFNFGTGRTERIEIKMPNKRFFKAEDGVPSEIFCQETNYEDCRLILQVVLRPPSTKIQLTEVEHGEFKVETVIPKVQKSGRFEWASFNIVDKTKLRFVFDNHYMELGYYLSPAEGQSRSAWYYTKYGGESNRQERISSGFYLLANNGKLDSYGGEIKQLNVMRGFNFSKLLVVYENNIRTTITIARNEPMVLDIITDFTPVAKLADFYLKVESDVQSLNKDFYHDANGYLVMRRELDRRPDFDFNIADGDNINANTYPVTSFAYIRNDLNKLVVSNDRAQGIALQGNNTLLINLDRYTGEDRRGAGEGYNFIIRGIYRHRIAITGPNDDIERQWQKQYDEALLAYYQSPNKNTQDNFNPDLEPTLHSKYLKFTTAFLTESIIVVRLQNLAEFSSITVKLTNNHNTLTLPDFNLELDIVKIEEAYHNGLPLTPRYKWNDLPLEQVVDIHQNQFDGKQVTLKPLQIRSFRVELGKARKSNLQKQP